MIDYLKLKIAHELAFKWSDQNNQDAGIEICKIGAGLYCAFTNNRAHSHTDHIIFLRYDNLDDLITKLIELTEPESPRPQPKFHKEQEVWAYTFGNAQKVKVDEIYWDKDLNDYRLSLRSRNGKMSIGQDMVYPSEKALIEAQLEFWCSKMDIIDEIKFWASRPQKQCLHSEKSMGLGNDFICKDCDAYVVPSKCSKNIHTESKPRSNAARVCDDIYQQLKDADFPRISAGKYETCTFELKPKECQHESDGTATALLCNPPIYQFKCKKCGEFYR